MWPKKTEINPLLAQGVAVLSTQGEIYPFPDARELRANRHNELTVLDGQKRTLAVFTRWDSWSILDVNPDDVQSRMRSIFHAG